LIKMVVMGDDNLLRHTGESIDFKRYMLRLGFQAECKYRVEEWDCEYCSNIFYDTMRGPVLGPKIGRVLAKLGYFINPPLFVHPKSVLKGVALGLLGAASYVPLIKVIVSRILEDTVEYDAFIRKDGDWALTYKECPVVVPQYQMLHRYDCLHQHVKWLERAVQNMEYDNPIFELLYDRDTDGVHSIFVDLN